MANISFLATILIGFTSTYLVQMEEKSDKHFWESNTANCSTVEIWDLWTDVSKWKEWDSGLRDATMEEKFVLNAKGIITSLEGRKSKFEVVEFENGRSYTIRTKLPLGGLYIKRHLESVGSQTKFTHEVWFKGLSSPLFAKLFGQKFRSLLPGVLEQIKEIVES